VLHLNRALASEDQRAFEDVAHLAHIAGLVMPPEGFQHRLGNIADFAAMLAVQVADQRFGYERNVLFALA
jgi:hypothetical protein